MIIVPFYLVETCLSAQYDSVDNGLDEGIG